MIRHVNLDDAQVLTEIYNYYILNTIVTFEETSIDFNEMKSRIQEVVSEYPWIVYEEDNEVIGYAYASKWKVRSAYKHSVESTVYLKNGAHGKGVGTKLYSELIKCLKKNNIHAVIGGISLPNEASIHLHEKLGFQKVAHFKEIGYKFAKRIDVAYWQLLTDAN